MVVPNATTDEGWRTRGREDASVAHRAVTRLALATDRTVPGYVCAYSILDAYGRDLKPVGPGVVNIHASDARLRILTQLMLDANHDEWIMVSSPSFDFMKHYRSGFIEEFDELMANWAAQPTRPGANATLVAEEAIWHGALAVGDLLIRPARKGWRRFLRV